MLTFTSDASTIPSMPPSEGYLRTIALGLRESHGWTTGSDRGYLARFPVPPAPGVPRSIEDLAA